MISSSYPLITTIPLWRSYDTETLTLLLLLLSRTVRSRSRVTHSGAELLRSGRELTIKVGEQPWPQLVHCALICYHMCG